MIGNLNNFETQTDYRERVENTPCPICLVSSGPCRNTSNALGGLTTVYSQTPRSDYHQLRKITAILTKVSNGD